MSPDQTRRFFAVGSDEPGPEVELVRYPGAPDGGVWFSRQGVTRGLPSRAVWIARGPNGTGRHYFWADLVREYPVVDCTDEVRR